MNVSQKKMSLTPENSLRDEGKKKKKKECLIFNLK